MQSVIKKVFPPSILDYWETLLLLMPQQFFSEELSKLGSFTIIFSLDGKNHLMINRYCSVYSPLPNEDEATVNVNDELSMDNNNSIGAQLKFKFTEKTKNLLVTPEENEVNDFVIKFFDEVPLDFKKRRLINLSCQRTW
jgi:hypothetical protein